MSATMDEFAEMKRFLSFDEKDAANLKELAPLFAKNGSRITDDFYDVLAKFSATSKLIEGRVDALKKTHGRWMGELFNGTYENDYFEGRLKIGMAHVRIGLPPWYVEAVMNLIRTHGHLLIVEEVTDARRVDELYGSLVRILDLDLMIINLAYAEERLDRMSAFTGMSRKLIENVINRAKK